MSAAKKSAKVSSVPEPTTAAKVPASKTAKPREARKLNPLPEDEVGPRLLVRLHAEKVMTKVRLKEKWEDVLGWDFDDLCAVVADALGQGYMADGEEVRLNRVIKFRDPKVIERIRKYASPALVDTANEIETILSEAYEGLLILGLGTPAFPITIGREYTESGELAVALAEIMEVDVGRVNARTFERAKQNVRELYATHLVKQEQRRSKRESSKPNAPLTVPGRSQSSLLREAIGQIVLEGNLPSPGVPKRKR
jgi:hypothetical protein